MNATFSGIALALIVWFYLIWHNKKQPVKFRELATLLILFGLICRLGFALLTPNFVAPDEVSHFLYIKHLAETGTLPIQPPIEETSLCEFYQPPLYYLSATPIYLLASKLSNNLDVVVTSIRFWSIFLWLGTVMIVIKTLQNLKIGNLFTKTFVVALLCFLPTYSFISSAINNDNLLIALGCLVFYIISLGRSNKNSLFLGLAIGAALLTKLSGVIYLALAGTILLLSWQKNTISTKSFFLHISIIISISLLLLLPWLTRNYLIYGELLALNIANPTYVWPSVPIWLRTVIPVMIHSFWSTAGQANDINYPSITGVWFFLLCLIGLLSPSISKTSIEGDKKYFQAFGLIIIYNLLLAFYFSWHHIYLQGRFLFPSLLPIALFMAIGLKSLGITKIFKQAHIHILGILLAYQLAFTIFVLQAMVRI